MTILNTLSLLRPTPPNHLLRYKIVRQQVWVLINKFFCKALKPIIFYNTRLTEKQIKQLDNLLTAAVRDLYGLYKSTTSLVIYLPRKNESIEVKRILDIYYSTRLAFLIKMLNHDVVEFIKCCWKFFKARYGKMRCSCNK